MAPTRSVTAATITTRTREAPAVAFNSAFSVAWTLTSSPADALTRSTVLKPFDAATAAMPSAMPEAPHTQCQGNSVHPNIVSLTTTVLCGRKHK